jgi:membrane-bound lytic murein transglycosylase F
MKFIIASYNVGQGHVQDARKLAEAFDADPDIWQNNVETYMLKKSDPEFYNLDYVHFGYASGIEPVTYIETIFELFEHYKKFIE